MINPVLGEQIVTDPELAEVLQVGAAVLIGVANEFYYYAAKKYGWIT